MLSFFQSNCTFGWLFSLFRLIIRYSLCYFLPRWIQCSGSLWWMLREWRNQNRENEKRSHHIRRLNAIKHNITQSKTKAWLQSYLCIIYKHGIHFEKNQLILMFHLVRCLFERARLHQHTKSQSVVHNSNDYIPYIKILRNTAYVWIHTRLFLCICSLLLPSLLCAFFLPSIATLLAKMKLIPRDWCNKRAGHSIVGSVYLTPPVPVWLVWREKRTLLPENGMTVWQQARKQWEHIGAERGHIKIPSRKKDWKLSVSEKLSVMLTLYGSSMPPLSMSTMCLHTYSKRSTLREPQTHTHIHSERENKSWSWSWSWSNSSKYSACFYFNYLLFTRDRNISPSQFGWKTAQKWKWLEDGFYKQTDGSMHVELDR